MNARTMRKGITPDNGFICRHFKTEHLRYHPACAVKMFTLYAGFDVKKVLASSYRHYDLFHSRVTCAFAYTVYRAFDLPGTV